MLEGGKKGEELVIFERNTVITKMATKMCKCGERKTQRQCLQLKRLCSLSVQAVIDMLLCRKLHFNFLKFISFDI